MKRNGGMVLSFSPPHRGALSSLSFPPGWFSARDPSGCHVENRQQSVGDENRWPVVGSAAAQLQVGRAAQSWHFRWSELLSRKRWAWTHICEGWRTRELVLWKTGKGLEQTQLNKVKLNTDDAATPQNEVKTGWLPPGGWVQCRLENPPCW